MEQNPFIPYESPSLEVNEIDCAPVCQASYGTYTDEIIDEY